MSVDEMPFHAKMAGQKPTGVLLSVIMEQEAQVVAQHDAGLISDAEFEAFRQRAGEHLSRLNDLNDAARAVREESRAHVAQREAEQSNDQGLADTYEAQLVLNREYLEAAARQNQASTEMSAAWVTSARDLVDLRATFSNADVAALDQDRATIADREAVLAESDARYAAKISDANESVEAMLAKVDMIAEFEQREAELTERGQAAQSQLEDYDRRIDALKAERAATNESDANALELRAALDRQAAELREERLAFQREMDETFTPERIQHLEQSPEVLRALAAPAMQLGDVDSQQQARETLTQQINASRAELIDVSDALAERTELYAERDAALAQIADNAARMEESARLQAEIDEFTASQRARVVEFKEETVTLRLELAEAEAALARAVQQQLEHGDALWSATAARLATGQPDDGAVEGSSSAPPQVDLAKLESTVDALREQLLSRSEAQVRDLDVAEREFYEAHPSLTPPDGQRTGDRGGAGSESGASGAVVVQEGVMVNEAEVIEAVYAHDAVDVSGITHDAEHVLVDDVDLSGMTDGLLTIASNDTHAVQASGHTQPVSPAEISSADDEGPEVTASV